MVALLEYILGRRLKSSERHKEALTAGIGVPVLGLDAVASTAYGPEAALTILAAAAAGGLHYFPAVTLCMAVLLAALYVSYR